MVVVLAVMVVVMVLVSVWVSMGMEPSEVRGSIVMDELSSTQPSEQCKNTDLRYYSAFHQYLAANTPIAFLENMILEAYVAYIQVADKYSVVQALCVLCFTLNCKKSN